MSLVSSSYNPTSKLSHLGVIVGFSVKKRRFISIIYQREVRYVDRDEGEGVVRGVNSQANVPARRLSRWVMETGQGWRVH